jgi:DNA mismatch repair protein MutS2
VGVPGKSSGLAIAQRLGLKREILERARQALSTQDEEVSRLLAQLHQTTEEAERLRGEAARREGELRERTAQVAAEWEKREKSRLAELEKRIQSLLVDLERRGRAEIQQIQDKRLLKEAERRVARAKREVREQYDTAVLEQLGGGAEEEPAPAEAAPDVHSLREGDMVRVKALGREGIVRRRLDFSTLEVEVGAMKMKVSLEQVEPLPPAARAAVSLPANVTVHTETRLDASFSEINVIGCTAEEARARVDKFLDSAVLAVVPRVRVVHGHGMGVLRKTLHEFFGTHPLVEKFYAAPQQEGGTGATIVELRV